MVAGLVNTYAPARGEPVLTYGFEALGAPRLLRDGALLYEAEHPLDLPSWFEMDLVHEIMDRGDRDAWMLHAAAVALDDGAVVLAGAAGSGKSTAALALVARGACYVTDEVVAIRGDGAVAGLARPIAIAGDRLAHGTGHDDAGAACGTRNDGARKEEAGEVPHCVRVPSPMRVPGGEVRVRSLFHPRAPHRQLAPASLRALAVIRFAPDEPPSARPLAPGRALETLWQHTRNPSQATLDRAALVLQRVRPYELTCASVIDLCDAVQEAVRGGVRTL